MGLHLNFGHMNLQQEIRCLDAYRQITVKLIENWSYCKYFKLDQAGRGDWWHNGPIIL